MKIRDLYSEFDKLKDLKDLDALRDLNKKLKNQPQEITKKIVDFHELLETGDNIEIKDKNLSIDESFFTINKNDFLNLDIQKPFAKILIINKILKNIQKIFDKNQLYLEDIKNFFISASIQGQPYVDLKNIQNISKDDLKKISNCTFEMLALLCRIQISSFDEIETISLQGFIKLKNDNLQKLEKGKNIIIKKTTVDMLKKINVVEIVKR